MAWSKASSTSPASKPRRNSRSCAWAGNGLLRRQRLFSSTAPLPAGDGRADALRAELGRSDRFLTQTDELVRRDMERTLAMSARATTAPGGRRSTSAFATPLASPVAKRAAIRAPGTPGSRPGTALSATASSDDFRPYSTCRLDEGDWTSSALSRRCGAWAATKIARVTARLEWRARMRALGQLARHAQYERHLDPSSPFSVKS